MTISQLAGDPKYGELDKTFIFDNEDHTLGNSLRSVISSYPNVMYCGYTIPHPAEKKMNFRIQVSKGRAIDALRRGLEDLVKICDHTIEKFDEAVYNYKMTQVDSH